MMLFEKTLGAIKPVKIDARNLGYIYETILEDEEGHYVKTRPIHLAVQKPWLTCKNFIGQPPEWYLIMPDYYASGIENKEEYELRRAHKISMMSLYMAPYKTKPDKT